MIPGVIFVDGFAREFVLYQGWKVVNEDGELAPDPFFAEPVEPFKQIPDPLSHGNWHTLTNLINEDGAKLLPRGVREVTFFADGYYLLYDDNEDELVNRGDVKGGFLAKDFRSRMNVLRSDGTLMSDDWFDDVSPLGNRLFIVTRGDDETIVDLDGIVQDKRLSHNDNGRTLKLGFEYCAENGRITIFDPLGNTVTDKGQSIMWENNGGIWHVSLYCQGKETTFWYGQGGGVIFYSQALLIKNDSIALVELEGVWHLLSSNGQLTEVFRWNCSALLDSQIKQLESTIPDGLIFLRNNRI